MFKFNFFYILKICVIWMFYFIGIYFFLIFLVELFNSNFFLLLVIYKNSVSFLELFIVIYDI